MRQSMIIIAFGAFLLGGCSNPHKRFYKTAVADFNAFRITTLLEKNPQQAEHEIESFAEEPGWKLSFSNSEAVDFIETGNISCPFIASQVYFLKNPRMPDGQVIVNMLYVHDGMGWNLISVLSEKRNGKEVISEHHYNAWEHDCEPKKD